MSTDDRLDRLEQRVATLETLIRQLVASPRASDASGAPSPPAPRARPVSRVVVPRVERLSGPEPAVLGAATSPPPGAAPTAAQPRRKLLDSEEWVGERGLLALGVLALILAEAYLLKLSFDRGWVSPLARCIGGAVAGAAVGAVGWRLEPRYRTYGAALIGCGAAIIYLAVWAAVRQYQFLPPTSGIIALALVSLALAAIAYSLDVEALGAAAAAGAFFAPIFLSPTHGSADALLVYLGAMAGALGGVAAKRRWRLAVLVVAASYFGLGWTVGTSSSGLATPTLLLWYGVAGGTAGLLLGLRERWWEIRSVSFWGGWALIASAAGERAGLPLLFAAVIMAAPLWWHGFKSPRIWPERTTPLYRGAEWSLGEALYFFVTPLFLAWAVRLQNPEWLDAHRGLAAALVGVPYVLAGYVRPRPAFALVGAAALGTAAWLHWLGLDAVWMLLGQGALWATLDHALGRTDGRWYATGTLLAALIHLLAHDLPIRAASDPAFSGAWAIALWATTLLTAALAAGLWRPVGPPDDVRAVRTALWVGTGGMVLFGITAEIRRFFLLHSAGRSAADLAGGLAVSAWWLVFATGLVVLGFRRGVRPVRQFGLAVAALAGAKVLLRDLSSLDALYRVGSVFILGLASLLVAYLYHRHARVDSPGA